MKTDDKIINETEDDIASIVRETVEKLKGKNYATAVAILRSIRDGIEIHLTLT